MDTATLYPLLTPSLLSTARHRLRGRPEDAEDVVQETWRRAVQASIVFDSLAGAKAWLHTVLQHIVIDLYRKGRPDSELLEVSSVAEDHYPSVEYAEWFAMVDSLTVRERRIAVLLASGYDYQEAADRLGMALGSYKVAVHRLREKLRGS